MSRRRCRRLRRRTYCSWHYECNMYIYIRVYINTWSHVVQNSDALKTCKAQMLWRHVVQNGEYGSVYTCIYIYMYIYARVHIHVVYGRGIYTCISIDVHIYVVQNGEYGSRMSWNKIDVMKHVVNGRSQRPMSHTRIQMWTEAVYWCFFFFLVDTRLLGIHAFFFNACYTCIYMYMYVYIYTCIYMHIYRYTCIYTTAVHYMYIYTGIYIHVYIYIHNNIHVYTYIYIYRSRTLKTSARNAPRPRGRSLSASGPNRVAKTHKMP